MVPLSMRMIRGLLSLKFGNSRSEEIRRQEIVCENRRLPGRAHSNHLFFGGRKHVGDILQQRVDGRGALLKVTGTRRIGSCNA